MSMDGSSMNNQTLNNRSVQFNAADGQSLDIGDGEDEEKGDDKSDSEEERRTLYGNDASNFLSYSKMMHVMDEKHPRKKIINEET